MKYIVNTPKIKRKRKRKLIYFNPPFCKSVKTKVGKIFLALVKKHFSKNKKIGKYFNIHNLKLSYCTMTNMKDQIAKHNAKITSQSRPAERKTEKKCICRNRANCPMDGNCAESSVIYQAKVLHNKSKLPDMVYYGSTSMQFKKRYYGHERSFRIENSSPTGLSNYVWKLKNLGWQMNTDFKIKWSILK